MARRGCQKALTSITLKGKYFELADPESPYTSTSLEIYSFYYSKNFRDRMPNMKGRGAWMTQSTGITWKS
jgi:hypothetical protein